MYCIFFFVFVFPPFDMYNRISMEFFLDDKGACFK